MLLALTFLPLLGALVLLAVPSGNRPLLRSVALGTTLAAAVLAVALFASFDGTSALVQRAALTSWFTLPLGPVGARGIPVHLHLGVDGLSLMLVALTALLMPIAIVSTFGHLEQRLKEFLVWMLVMETGMLGVFAALDIVLFYFFWEVSLVPLYFIVGIWGGERRLYATLKFFLYTFAGSLVMLVGVIWLVYALGTADVAELTQRAARLPLGTQSALFLSFALAFAIKVPLIPFHTWLADAHTEAPTAGSVLLAGVLLKMGTYGLLRFGIGLFPQAAIAWAPLFMALGALGIVYGALLALAQNDLKRLIACSSVSHLGYVVLGLFALTQAGLRGGVLQMVNHGLSTGLLFLLVGMLYERRHTRAIDHFGGLAASMPVFAAVFVFAVLSSVALPGLNGFVGEYLILLGSFQTSPLWASVAVLGVIFGAVYLLSATRRVVFGPLVHAENAELSDMNARELALCAPVIALCVWIGVAPNAFLGKLDGSIDALCERLDGARVALHERAGAGDELVAELAPPGAEGVLEPVTSELAQRTAEAHR